MENAGPEPIAALTRELPGEGMAGTEPWLGARSWVEERKAIFFPVSFFILTAAGKARKIWDWAVEVRLPSLHSYPRLRNRLPEAAGHPGGSRRCQVFSPRAAATWGGWRGTAGYRAPRGGCRASWQAAGWRVASGSETPLWRQMGGPAAVNRSPKAAGSQASKSSGWGGAAVYPCHRRRKGKKTIHFLWSLTSGVWGGFTHKMGVIIPQWGFVLQKLAGILMQPWCRYNTHLIKSQAQNIQPSAFLRDILQ